MRSWACWSQHQSDGPGAVGDIGDVEVPCHQRAEDALHRVEHLNGGGRIVDRRRERPQADVGQQPEREQRILADAPARPANAAEAA